MPRSTDSERGKRIRGLRNQGFSLRQIAQMENVSPATVSRTLGPAVALEQRDERHIRSLESRVKALEEQAAVSKEFFEIVAKMSGFLGSTFRDQLTTVLRRWPQPMVTIRLAGNSRDEPPKVVVVPRDLVIGEDPE